ncbi:MAG TPA: hypothetical protein VFG77_03770 [Nitrososphaeraceae archaeon]|nr:hypothetical protein [Nitrososphaeraceae archaeon]
MINTFIVSALLGFAITMILIFSQDSQFSTDTVQVSGYEQNTDEYTKNSCGNGILPENIPCKNAESNAKGDKNIVNIEGIIFP